MEVKHKVVLADPKEFIDSLNIVGKLVSEAEFKLSKDGLKIVAMDPANVAMVIFNFKAAGFINFDCPEDAGYGVNFSQLMPVLKRLKGKDAVTIGFGDKIFIKSTGREFEIPILADIETTKDKIPELEFKATVRAKSEEVAEAIEDIKLVTENSGRLVCNKGKFAIIGEGDLSKADVDLVPTEVVVTQEETVEGRYSVEYLGKMMDGKKISDEVTLRYSKDYPLKLEFKSGSIELAFILAPRVDNT